MNTHDYLIASSRTASDQYHKEIVSDATLEKILKETIEIGNKIDQVKKSIFYGRALPENYSIELGESSLNSDLIDPNLLHGAIGVLTEATEILEALEKAMKGQPIDTVNLKEELGDIEWYMAMLYRGLNTTPEAVKSRNIEKLSARYPEKFTSDHAILRNLQKEREILEKD